MSIVKKTLGALFVGSLAASNVVASKVASFGLPIVGDVVAPAGFLGIALAFLFSDLIGELYGEREAREIVNAAIISMVGVYAVVYSAVMMPAAPFYQYAGPFNSIMSAGGTIVAASIITLLVSQNIDVSIFHGLKRRTNIKAVRNVTSTVVSQAVDTAMFIGLAFVVLPHFLGGQPMAVTAATGLAVSQYIAKVGVAILDTPLFYAASSALEK